MVVVALLLGVSEIGCAWVTRTWPHWPKDTGTHQALVEFATGPTENSMSHIGYNWSSDSEKNLLTLSSVWLRFRFHTHGYDNEAISINVPGEPKDFFIDEAHVDEKNITSYYGYATIRVPHGEQPRYLYVRIENPISYPFEYIYGPYDQHRLAIAVKTAQFRGVHLSRYQWAIVKTPYNWRNAFVWRTLTSFYPSITNEQTEIAFELVDDRIEDDSALVVELWPNYKGIRITFDKRVVYEETAKGTYRGSEVAIARSETNHLLIRTIPEMTARRIEMIVAFKDSSALESAIRSGLILRSMRFAEVDAAVEAFTYWRRIAFANLASPIVLFILSVIAALVALFRGSAGRRSMLLFSAFGIVTSISLVMYGSTDFVFHLPIIRTFRKKWIYLIGTICFFMIAPTLLAFHRTATRKMPPKMSIIVGRLTVAMSSVLLVADSIITLLIEIPVPAFYDAIVYPFPFVLAAAAIVTHSARDSENRAVNVSFALFFVH